MVVTTLLVDVGTTFGKLAKETAGLYTDFKSNSYICGGRQNRCRCPTEDTEEPAPDGDLEARTLVTAMQQTNLDGAH